jgi:RNA methyltransferase, TrmH family
MIQSLQHPLVKKALSLRLKRQFREKEQRVLISGKKLINDLSSVWPIEILFYRETKPELSAFENVHVSPAVLKKMTGLEEPDGLAAIVRLPEEKSLYDQNHILILDQISDPGNLGTLWRSALALGWEGIWLLPGCVDPFNDKALRAAQGSTFSLPFEHILKEKIIEWAQKKKASLYTADLHGMPLHQCIFSKPRALILGNEGQGPGPWTQSISSRITIPILPAVESLNVASAGAILLYAMRPV